MNIDLSAAFDSIKAVKTNYENAIEYIKAKLPEMDAESQKVVSEGIGKVEKVMRELKFPTLEELSSGNFSQNNNEIIHKLEAISVEFQKLRDKCLL